MQTFDITGRRYYERVLSDEVEADSREEAQNEIDCRLADGEGEMHLLEGQEEFSFATDPFRVEESEAEGRVIAEFRPQKWVMDYSQPAGPNQYWDVTELVLQMDAHAISHMHDNDYPSDRLVYPYSGHDGPHSVRVEGQIAKFFASLLPEHETNGSGIGGPSADNSLTPELLELARQRYHSRKES